MNTIAIAPSTGPSTPKTSDVEALKSFGISVASRVEKFDGFERVFAEVDLSLIDPTPFNPPGRDEGVKLRKLRKEIASAGGILVPVHLVPMENGRLVPADGNRRIAIARERGMTTIPAYVYMSDAGTPQQLLNKVFLMQNRGTQPHRPAERLATLLQEGPAYDSQAERAADRILQLLEPAEIDTFIAKQMSPHTVTMAYAIARYCLRKFKKEDEDDKAFKEFTRKALLWLINNNVKRDVSVYIRRRLSPEVLARTVEENKPRVPRVSMPVVGRQVQA